MTNGNLSPREADCSEPVEINSERYTPHAPLGLQQITTRQLQCLAWVQEGKSASDIGGILGISSRTVEGHLQKICQHLGVKTRFQAVLKALDVGLLRRPHP